ncbi:MAG: hypothetical protein IJW33_00340, partial [Lentisphaeria bacterium]|nr:hypothetical protein [Lentisphaeria bacterium]
TFLRNPSTGCNRTLFPLAPNEVKAQVFPQPAERASQNPTFLRNPSISLRIKLRPDKPVGADPCSSG